MTGWRLPQTDLVRMKGGPQGPGGCDRCFRPSAWGTGRRSRTIGGAIGTHFIIFDPLRASPKAQMTGWRLPETDLVRGRGAPQGPGGCCRGLRPVAGGIRFRLGRGSLAQKVEIRAHQDLEGPKSCIEDGGGSVRGLSREIDEVFEF